MRKSEQRWPRREMPPFKKSFLWQALLIWSSYYLGVSLPQFPFAIWAKHWLLPHNWVKAFQLLLLYLSQRDHQLWVPQAAQLDPLELFPSNTFLARYPLGGHSPCGVPIFWVHCQPLAEKVGPLSQWLTQWSSWQEVPCWLPRGWG